MSLPHNCAIQTSRGICHRRLWLQNQSAIVLQQIRSNHLPARGLQSGRNARGKRRGGSCWQVTSLSTGCPPARPSNLEREHSRSAQTVAFRGLRQGTQGRTGGSRVSFCEHLLGLGRHRPRWLSGTQAKPHQVYHHWCRTSWHSHPL